MHLSTREESGSKIIETLVNRKVETVLDPTLLLEMDDWKKISSDYADNMDSYLLVYMLGKDENQWKEITSIAASMRLKVKIIPVFFKDLKRDGCVTDPIGPEEFLSLVQNATYICTDSFHGLLFSIIFHAIYKNHCFFQIFNKGWPSKPYYSVISSYISL